MNITYINWSKSSWIWLKLDIRLKDTMRKKKDKLQPLRASAIQTRIPLKGLSHTFFFHLMFPYQLITLTELIETCLACSGFDPVIITSL